MAKWREPLRIPQSWKDQARAFVIQLERILDKLFNRTETNEEKIAENAEGIAENSELIQEIINKPYFDAKAIKNITRSGTTFTATCLDDTTFTFTQQDNDHYAWADITGKPSTFPPSSHSHTNLAHAEGNVASTNTSAYALGALNIRWFTQTGKVPGQPSQWGFMATVATADGASENHQLWFEQANGSMYHRGTNGSSYTSPPVFAKLLDSNNYTSYAAKSTEAIKNITRSGTTFTATRCDNTTFTFTQQDNNTWRGYQTKAYSYSYSIGAGAILNVTGTNLGVSTPSGYTPISMTQVVSGNNDVDVVSYRANQTGGEWVVRLHNRASATKTGSVYVVIFYLQS